MDLIRWNPFYGIDTLHRRFNDLLEDRSEWSGFPDRTPISRWSPRVDISEDEHSVAITAEIPGMGKDEVSVDVDNGVLTISGEKKFENEDKKDNYTRVERYYGSFHRSFTLPSTIDISKIEATMEKGVLKVVMPRTEESKPKKIEVKIN